MEGSATRRAEVKEYARIAPDVLRLLKGLSRVPGVPRWRLVLLLGYLALPFDLVPDFSPVLGYADDVLLVVWVLRSVVRRAGADAVERHWPGTPDGLALLRRLARL